MLRRPTAQQEIINDLDPVVSNWWLVVRDHVEELIEMLEWTPHKSRPMYEECVDRLAEPPVHPIPSVSHAWALAVVQANSLMSLGVNHAWGLKLTNSARITKVMRSEDLRALSSRVQCITIHNEDAIDVLKNTISDADALIYADPPYLGAFIEPYRATTNINDLTEVLIGHSAKIACSGYPGQMPMLEKAGWVRHDYKTYVAVAYSAESGSITDQRTECLWMNYDPPQERLFTANNGRLQS